jgi:hypothetical protein
MAFTPYLQANEYATYGIPEATSAQVAAASRQVNGYLGRPEGLIWSPDANGMPCCMANLNPTRGYTATLAPGTNVAVTIPNATFGFQTVGEVVILDRGNPSLIEACVVTAASGDTLTLASVQFTHTAASLDFGLTLLEETTVGPGAPVVRTSRWPLAQIQSGFSRYSSGKLPRQITDYGYGIEALLLSQNIGLSGPPAWTQMDITQWDTNYNTGAVTVLPYPLRSALIDVRMNYIAGWSPANLPGDVKQAVASMVRSGIDTPFSGNIKLLKAGDGTIERFGPGTIDADTKYLLQPYKLVRIG